MKRKKILCMSDSSKLHTGFASVTKNIFTYLTKTGKYEIVQIGWFHQETNEDCTYPIWLTEKDRMTGKLTQEDKYAHKSFAKYVDKFKPDLVWTLGDMWMIDHVAMAPNRDTFKWIGYFPIDGEPSPSKWGSVVENMDIAVAYGNYGKNVVSKRAPNANLTAIYHGVNTEVFCPKDIKDITHEKKALLGVNKDKKVIGIVARNQPRKAFDKLFKAYFYVLNGQYAKCNSCEKLTLYPYSVVEKKFGTVSKCKHCGSTIISKGSPKDDVVLYVHAAALDCGWELIDLQQDFDLRGKVLINPDLKIGVGVSEMTLAAIYNTFDIFTLPTRGEGFGLPILEAMSCGVPIVVTNYSAPSEWANDCGELVNPITYVAEPLTNIRRAIIDMDLYVTALIKLLDDEDLRKKCGKKARERALTMDWKSIVKQWEHLIDSVLYPDGVPEIKEPNEMKYMLEEI